MDCKRASIALFMLLWLCPPAWAEPVTHSDGTRPTLNATQMRADLAYLRDVWLPQDHSFTPEERLRFRSVIADAVQRAGQFTRADFSLVISRAVALAHNGHTSSSLGADFHPLPIRVQWFADGLYVVSAHPRYVELVGARVVRFGALSPEQALERVAPYISGTDTRVRALSAGYFGLLEVLHRIGATPDASQLSITLRLRSGAVRTVSLGRAPSPDPSVATPCAQPWLALVPGEPGTPGRWVHVLDGVRGPDGSHRTPIAYLRPANLSWQWLAGHAGVLYVRSTCIEGSEQDRYELMDKLLGLLQYEVAPKRPHSVILDLRLNGGGDFFNAILFAQALPKLILADGRIFVLVGPGTFSAALVTAAMLKGYGGDRVTLVGEPMGDRSPFWSEGVPVTLPNSRIQVRPARWMQNWEDGCRDRARCYWANSVFWVRRISLEPAVRVPLTFAEYAAGRDPVLEAALERSRAEGTGVRPPSSSADPPTISGSLSRSALPGKE